MTGRLSALRELVTNVASLVGALLGGWMIVHASLRIVFLMAAAFTGVVFGHGLWRPPEMFVERNEDPSPHPDIRSAVRLFAGRGVWLTLAAFALFSFSPNWGTSLLYYLTDSIKLSPEAFAAFRAASFAGSAAAVASYSWLCTRLPLRHLLWWAIVLNICPAASLLLTRSAPEAIALSVVIGALTGFGSVALWDLLLRSCPRDLEGTTNMLCISVYGIAGAVGDLSGAWIYSHGGFTACVIVDAIATASILPLLPRLPGSLICPKDGEFAFPLAVESSVVSACPP